MEKGQAGGGVKGMLSVIWTPSSAQNTKMTPAMGGLSDFLLEICFIDVSLIKALTRHNVIITHFERYTEICF